MMPSAEKPSFLLLFLLISFGSITAVAPTPALPAIAQFFHIDAKAAGLVISLFLVGYAIGQLLYGPLANRLGRKIALYIGIGLEIISAFLCIIASPLHAFWLLLLARLLMALGASVGLQMSFTLVADAYHHEESRKLIAHLIIAFAITPALGVAIGGVLMSYFSWVSNFYFMALYGIILLLLTFHMSETKLSTDKNALKLPNILAQYWVTLTHFELPVAALLMGFGTSFVYLFASLAPFITIDFMGLHPSEYGYWNLLPVIGVIAGSQLSRYLTRMTTPIQTIFIGIIILMLGLLILLIAFFSHHFHPIFLFLPQLIIYIGNGCVYSNAALIATAKLSDKSNASAMMSFLNVSIPTLAVFSLQLINVYSVLLLPLMYVALLMAIFIFALILFSHLHRA